MRQSRSLFAATWGLICCFCFLSCGGSGNSSAPASTPQPTQSAIARQYLSEVLTILQDNAVTRNSVDWGNLEAEVNAIAANAQSISDTYPAITRALELIDTNHSFLLAADGSLITYPSTIRCEQSFAMDSLDEPDIGYVRVDAVSSPSASESRLIAQNIQTAIATQDNQDVTKWVIDLRNNFGGNMWPMIAGLGPLFDQPLLGHFVDADETPTAWGYQDGHSFSGTSPIVQIEQPYTLINPLPKIAVLVSRRTASSGEATMIAFKQQFNVRFFGTNSCGLSTANSSFQLSDGTVLFLTTAITADRNQLKYGERVPVDQKSSPEDAILLAVEWLRN